MKAISNWAALAPEKKHEMMVPVISPAHFSKADCEELESDAVFNHVDNCGFIIKIDDGNVSAFNVSPQARKLLRAFEQEGYNFLRIDRDATHIKGIKLYAW